MRPLTPDLIRDAVARALEEDVGPGDATTLATIPADALADAALVAREALVVCGLEFAREAFQQLSPNIQCEPGLDEGRMAGPGTRLMRVHGPASAILTGERVMLSG
jgi:nicotinate-nucleotide pyrophosphorylase (carboxylating)